MKELIEIGTTKIGDGTVNTVNARDLQKFLGIDKDFSDWIKAQIKRARLVENTDYILVPQKGEQTGSGGSNRTDYHLTLEAMVCLKAPIADLRQPEDCATVDTDTDIH